MTLVGNGGLVSVADAGLHHLRTEVRADRLNLAALAALADGQLALFSAQGVLHQALIGPH